HRRDLGRDRRGAPPDAAARGRRRGRGRDVLHRDRRRGGGGGRQEEGTGTPQAAAQAGGDRGPAQDGGSPGAGRIERRGRRLTEPGPASVDHQPPPAQPHGAGGGGG